MLATYSLNENRKRHRPFEDEQILEIAMDIDESKSVMRAINELSGDELRLAQTLAQEGIKAALFISVEIPDHRTALDSPMDIGSVPTLEKVTRRRYFVTLCISNS
jgi:hypothetical protein